MEPEPPIFLDTYVTAGLKHRHLLICICDVIIFFFASPAGFYNFLERVQLVFELMDLFKAWEEEKN